MKEILFFFYRICLKDMDPFEDDEGNKTAGAAGNGKEGNIEESAFCRSHKERGNRIGNEATDKRGAREFSKDSCPQFFRAAVQVSRQEGADHRAGEGEKRSGTDDIPDHRCGKGGGNTIPRAAENRKKDIDHVLERESTGHSQRKGKDR